MRVHTLATALNVTSKTIVEKCKAEGIDTVKNHMSTLSAGLHATILEWFSEGNHDTAVETSKRVDLKKVRVAPKRKRTTNKAAAENTVSNDDTVGTAEAVGASTAVAEPPGTPPDTPDTATAPPPAKPEAEQPSPTNVPEIAAVPGEQTVPPSDAPEIQPSDAVEERPKVAAEKKPPVAVGPQNVPAAAKLQGPRVVRYEAPDYNVGPPRRRTPTRPPTAAPGAQPGSPVESGSQTDKKTSKAPSSTTTTPVKRKGRMSSRQAAGRAAAAGERMVEWRDRDLAERQERLAGATGRRIHRRRSASGSGGGAHAAPMGPITSATVHEPIRMKEFCTETGLNFMQLFRVLKEEHNMLANIAMTLPIETAELLSLHFGIELTVIPAKTKLDELEDEFAALERKNIQPRSPIVTMLGHVDHGKTSLLDAIRKTRVADGEDGGITQHISSYHLETAHGPVTMLDTPGHAAFSAMRARGAQLTDVVVLVIAADDGVMPQTIEAINHAKAAKAPIVVALNKIDLGDQNRIKLYGQLSEHGLTPSGDWGGEIDVIDTSAKMGTGITELVEHLADLASVLELKADPTIPAMGRVIEAQTKQGVGAVVQVLIQEGTLRVGAFVVCGNACGKVRALINDQGEKITEAGPAIPVEVWGLDDVPLSGDKLYQVNSMQRAKDIATETQQARLVESRAGHGRAKTLEEMFTRRDASEVPELNVIIKADVDGSIAGMRQALNEIPSEEVRLTLRHTGVGAVNEGDVALAAACGGIIVAFRVDVNTDARRAAENQGVDVRSYRVIYQVCDDIKKALEGLLEPERREESRGALEVRQIFRVSKTGVVAGSFVVEGTIVRSHLARLIRDGVVIREGCKLESLRHFKDDVKEVRSNLECGVRLEGFDDVHVGDRIETYEIVEIARTL